MDVQQLVKKELGPVLDFVRVEGINDADRAKLQVTYKRYDSDLIHNPNLINSRDRYKFFSKFHLQIF